MCWASWAVGAQVGGKPVHFLVLCCDVPSLDPPTSNITQEVGCMLMVQSKNLNQDLLLSLSKNCTGILRTWVRILSFFFFL
jgi:hypothetical protein